jgi:peptidoglycan L-alanyl-D-glutamate endopeptidase CwlK
MENEMPCFSEQSLEKLATCHIDLQTLFKEVIKYFDCTVIEGFRNKEAQNKAFAEGKSQKQWPDGKHNFYPSNAVDVVPYPIDWKDRERMVYFAGVVMGIAKMLKAQGKITHDIRWGNDWNTDTEVKDNNFDDLPHYELILTH